MEWNPRKIAETVMYIVLFGTIALMLTAAMVWALDWVEDNWHAGRSNTEYRTR